MQHAGDVSAAIGRLDDERLGRTARQRIIDGIRESLALWWQTADVRRARPQVDDEVRRNLHFFDRVLFDAVPELVRELERCFGERPLDFAPLRFSSWAGGDMDGHPGVTAATYTATVDLHRRVAMRLLRDRVERLASRSSQGEAEMGPGRAALEASMRRDGALMPEVTRRLGDRRRHEPVRAKLNYVSERLLVSGETPDSPLAYRTAEQLLRDLELVRDAVGSASIADGAVKDLLRQVSAFGLHLARLDIRLDADAIGDSVRRDLPELAGADEHVRRAILDARLATVLPDRFGPICVPTEALHAMSAAARRYGGASDTLVVSMVHEVTDVLGALWLARRAGLGGPGEPSLHITPLFETLAALEQAPETMAALYADAAYREHLAPPRRPPGDHARLLGLGQGRRLPHQPVGDLPRAGAARRAGARARRRGDVLPRPRRLAVARRRARPPGDPRPAARNARRRRADHRAGRGDLGQVRRPGAGGPLARAAAVGAAARPRGAGRRSARRLPRRDRPRRRRARATSTARSSTTRTSCASSTRCRRSTSCPS